MPSTEQTLLGRARVERIKIKPGFPINCYAIFGNDGGVVGFPVKIGITSRQDRDRQRKLDSRFPPRRASATRLVRFGEVGTGRGNDKEETWIPGQTGNDMYSVIPVKTGI